MPSNLPPGVTDRMVDAQFDHDDVELADAREWYLGSDKFFEHLAEWVTDVTYDHILDRRLLPDRWIKAMLDDFFEDNENNIIESYIESLEDV